MCANRDYLRGLYGVIKDSDAHVHFTFLTGITKFSKGNLFSQLNNLTDLTLDPRLFVDLRLHGAATWTRCSRRSSAGWTGSGCGSGTMAMAGSATEKVYNPYDVLLLLRRP